MAAPALPEPTEVAQRAYREILLNELGTGLAEFRRPTMGLFLSSLSGGLDVSFSLLLMATIHTLVVDLASHAATRLWVANMYSVGFIFIVVGRSERSGRRRGRPAWRQAALPCSAALDGRVAWLEAPMRAAKNLRRQRYSRAHRARGTALPGVHLHLEQDALGYGQRVQPGLA